MHEISGAQSVGEAISAIFARVLGSRPIGKHVDFFDAGGDSLATTQAVAGSKDNSRSTCRYRRCSIDRRWREWRDT